MKYFFYVSPRFYHPEVNINTDYYICLSGFLYIHDI